MSKPVTGCGIVKDSWPLAAQVIAEGGSTADAAAAADVSIRTVKRWVLEPDFDFWVQDERGLMVGRGASLLAGAIPRAVKVLIRNMDADKPANSAAVKILELAAKYRYDFAVEERLREVEQVAGIRKIVARDKGR